MAKELPAPATTIQDILKLLNKNDTGEGDWVRIPGYYGISSPEIASDTSLNFTAAKTGMVLVNFLNSKTMEIKSFAAKWTDDPIREKLWPQ